MNKLSVAKHNNLIEAKIPKISVVQGRAIAYMVAQIHSKKSKDVDTIEMSPHEWSREFGFHYKSIDNLKGELRALASLQCVIENEKTWEVCSFVDYAKIEKESGNVTMRLGKEMLPYLLELHENYTWYNLLEYKQLKSRFSQRFYELYQKNKNKSHFFKARYELDELKEKLGCCDMNAKGEIVNYTFPRIDSFESKVLNKARKDLADLGILINYDFIRKGRPVNAIDITFSNTARLLKDKDFAERNSLISSMPLTNIEKLDIAFYRTKNEIEKATTQGAVDGVGYKYVKNLIPKSRKERAKLLKVNKAAKSHAQKIAKAMIEEETAQKPF